MRTFTTRVRWGTWAVGAALGAAALLAPSRASAALNAGVEYGMVKRSADDPYNFKLGTGWGAHLEASLLPMLNLGPYYLHYELGNPNDATSLSHDTRFDVVGLRARFMLPVPGSDWKPYAYAGIGYTWVSYGSLQVPFDVTNPAARSGGFEARSGHFLETPVGVGIAYELAKIIHLSADFALRPGMSFGGAAYDDDPGYGQPKFGWSLMAGAALNL
jgi:opacity protein-like surface antigen